MPPIWIFIVAGGVILYLIEQNKTVSPPPAGPPPQGPLPGSVPPNNTPVLPQNTAACPLFPSATIDTDLSGLPADISNQFQNLANNPPPFANASAQASYYKSLGDCLFARGYTAGAARMYALMVPAAPAANTGVTNTPQTGAAAAAAAASATGTPSAPAIPSNSSYCPPAGTPDNGLNALPASIQQAIQQAAFPSGFPTDYSRASNVAAGLIGCGQAQAARAFLLANTPTSGLSPAVPSPSYYCPAPGTPDAGLSSLPTDVQQYIQQAAFPAGVAYDPTRVNSVAAGLIGCGQSYAARDILLSSGPQTISTPSGLGVAVAPGVVETPVRFL